MGLGVAFYSLPDFTVGWLVDALIYIGLVGGGFVLNWRRFKRSKDQSEGQQAGAVHAVSSGRVSKVLSIATGLAALLIVWPALTALMPSVPFVDYFTDGPRAAMGWFPSFMIAVAAGRFHYALLERTDLSTSVNSTLSPEELTARQERWRGAFAVFLKERNRRVEGERTAEEASFTSELFHRLIFGALTSLALMAYALYIMGKGNPELNVVDDLLQNPQNYRGVAGFGLLAFTIMSKWGYDAVGRRVMSMKRLAISVTGLLPLLALSLWNDPTQLYRLSGQSLGVTAQGSLHALGQTPYLALAIAALYLVRPGQMNSLFTGLLPFIFRAHLHYARGSMEEVLNRYRLSIGLINTRDFIGMNTSALLKWVVAIVAGILGGLVALEALQALGYSANGWEVGLYLWHMAAHAWKAASSALSLDVGGMFSALNECREAFEDLVASLFQGGLIRFTVTGLASLVATVFAKHLYVKAANKLARALDAVVLPLEEDLSLAKPSVDTAKQSL